MPDDCNRYLFIYYYHSAFACFRGLHEYVKLLYPDARINASAHAFPVRIVSLWNRLPANIVLPANLKQFKMAIKNIDFWYALIGKD